MGLKRRQTKEQFIKSRETARAAETKAAEAKRMQDEALARRNLNRTRLDLYRNKLRQQPAQPGMAANPIGRIEARLPQPPIPGMAGNAIGNAVGNQVIGGSGKPMSRPMQQESDQSIAEEANRRELKIKPNQPGMAANLAQQENVQKFQFGGFVLPQSQFDFNNNSIVTSKQGQDVYGRQSNTMAAGLNTNVSDDMSTGSTALQPDKFSNITQQDIDTVKQDDLKPNQDSNINVNAAVGALKTLANAIEPKEEIPETQYRSFTVDDNSGQVRDVMSARREALMKMMGGR